MFVEPPLLPRLDGVDHVLPELCVVLLVAGLVRNAPVLEEVVLRLVMVATDDVQVWSLSRFQASCQVLTKTKF